MLFFARINLTTPLSRNRSQYSIIVPTYLLTRSEKCDFPQTLQARKREFFVTISKKVFLFIKKKRIFHIIRVLCR